MFYRFDENKRLYFVADLQIRPRSALRVLTCECEDCKVMNAHQKRRKYNYAKFYNSGNVLWCKKVVFFRGKKCFEYTLFFYKNHFLGGGGAVTHMKLHFILVSSIWLIKQNFNIWKSCSSYLKMTFWESFREEQWFLLKRVLIKKGVS